MAITLDAQTVSNSTAPADPFTFSHTIGAGASVVFAVITYRGNVTISAVTFGGSAMTLVRADGPTSFVNTAIYYLLAPTAGANTFSFDCSVATNAISVQVASFFGTATTTAVIDASNGVTGTDTDGVLTFDVTPISDNCWVLEGTVIRTAAGETLTQGAESGRTDWSPDWEYEPGGNTLAAAGTYYSNVSPAAAKTFSWTVSTSDRPFSMSGVAIAPASTTKTGVSVSPAVAAGSDQAIFVEQGQSASPGIAAGSDQAIFVEQGAPTSPAVAAGADQAVWSESSPAVSPAVAAGADATTFTETGEAASPAVATAQDQAIWQEQGSATAPAIAAAEDQAVWQEQGSSTAPAVAAGPDEFTAIETGAAASPAVASGQSQLISAGGGTLYVKTGEAAAPGVAAGPDQFIAAETSAAVSPAVAEGSDQAIFGETGAAAANAVASGVSMVAGRGGASDMNWVPFEALSMLPDPNVEIIIHGQKRRKQPAPELAYADEEVLLMLV